MPNPIHSALTRFAVHERVFTLTVGCAIGIVAGFGSIAVREAIPALGRLFEALRETVGSATGLWWLGVLLAPALGGLIIGPLIHRYAREARGHGVPEVMLAVARRGGFIRPRVVVVKTIASVICIASGGSVGREGPIVQIGSAMGSTMGFLLRVPPRLMRVFVACGAAGGIAATFNAPIAGALFAVEIILGDFGFIQLAPIVTSSVTATVISRGLAGDFAAFQVPPYELVHPVELIVYAGLGLLCAIVAVGFIRLLDGLEVYVEKRVKLHEALQPMAGGLMVGAIGLLFPQVFGIGYATIDLALHDALPLYLLGALVVAKLVATSLTLSSGGSGGIFAPSLFMGAMTGGMVGKLANLALPGLAASSGAYALVGMGAMVGAATHAPITAIVILFELTNDYKIILPLMISTIVSTLAANAFYRESIYTDKLRRKGIDLHQGLELNVLKKVSAGDIMRKGYEAAPHDLPFNFLVDLVMQSSHAEVPVVDGDGRIVGVVTRDQLKRHLFEKDMLSDMVIAKDMASESHPVLLQDETLDQANLRFQEFRCRELFVVDSLEHRKLVGVVYKDDLMDAYHREMVKRAAGDVFAYNINHPHRMETVDVMDGYGIIELEAPHEFSGKLLRELDLRNRYGITVLAIKRPASDGPQPDMRLWVPESGDRIEDGDILVLMGEHEKIDAFHRNF